MERRWGLIARRVLDYCKSETLSNERGIAAAMTLLGVDKPWEKIASQAGEREHSLRERIKRVVTRRNDIVHRADRSVTDPHGQPSPIDNVWTQNHVGAINTVAMACFTLARERVKELSTGVPPDEEE